MTNEKSAEYLLRAIGEIDDKFIVEANTPYTVVHQGRRWGNIAAAVALVTVLAVGGARLAPAFAPSFGASGGSANDGYGAPNDEGDGAVEALGTLTSGSSSARFVDYGGGIICVYITLSEDVDDLPLTLYGTNANGKYVSLSTTAADNDDAESAPSEDEVGGTPAPTLTVRVDGEAVSELPTKAGEYTVEVDYSALLNEGYDFTQISLERFGSIRIEK